MQEERDMERKVLDLLIYKAISEFDYATDPVRIAVGRVYGFADRMDKDPKLSQEVKERIHGYVNEAEELSCMEYRQLYAQGAKDCVEALRKLGVIK